MKFYFRVKGIRSLRVADASVIRNSPSGLLNAPVMMIVEKVSDMIKHHRKHQTQDCCLKCALNKHVQVVTVLLI